MAKVNKKGKKQNFLFDLQKNREMVPRDESRA